MKLLGAILTLLILFSCSSTKKKKKLSNEELIKKQTKLLQEIRPILKSDELPFMNCQKLGSTKVEKENSYNSVLWKSLGDLSLREQSMAMGGNIMSLEHSSFGNIDRFFATVYSCEKMDQVNYVDIAGMCKASEERIFRIKYDPEELRDIGEEILKTKMRYYAISNYYKTYHYRDIKYSYTKKEYSGKAYFFKCL